MGLSRYQRRRKLYEEREGQKAVDKEAMSEERFQAALRDLEERGERDREIAEFERGVDQFLASQYQEVERPQSARPQQPVQETTESAATQELEAGSAAALQEQLRTGEISLFGSEGRKAMRQIRRQLRRSDRPV